MSGVSFWKRLKRGLKSLGRAGSRDKALEIEQLQEDSCLQSSSASVVVAAPDLDRGSGLSRPKGLAGRKSLERGSPDAAAAVGRQGATPDDHIRPGSAPVGCVSPSDDAGACTTAARAADGDLAGGAPTNEPAGALNGAPSPAGGAPGGADGTASAAACASVAAGGATTVSSGRGAAAVAIAAPDAPNTIPADDELGSCPPYGAKSVWGLRYTMEDKWAAVPRLVAAPLALTSPPSGRRAQLTSCVTSCVGAFAARGGHGSERLEKARLMTLSDSDGGGGGSGGGLLDELHYFGVFDGHGGADAARHCAGRLHTLLTDCLRSALRRDGAGCAGCAGADEPDGGGGSRSGGAPAPVPGPDGEWVQAALVRAFMNVDAEFLVVSQGSYVGTTAAVVLIGRTRIWVAHCGDTRTVLCRKGVAVALTSDHKASRGDEVARVNAAGGHVWWDRVMGELAVSRAIGDHCLRPYVIPEPEVTQLDQTPDDEVLVIASDGLWDVLGNQEAADMALHTLQAVGHSGVHGVASARKAASSLTKAALDRGTRDNVTVLVVDLRRQLQSHHPASPPRAQPQQQPQPGRHAGGQRHGSHAQSQQQAAAPASARVASGS